MDEPEVRIYRGGVGTAKDRAEIPTPTAVITQGGCQMWLRFAGEDDTAGEGPLLKVELLPEPGTTLDPSAVRQFIPQFWHYLAYARAAMRILGTTEGTPQERWEAYSRSVEQLRQIGRPGRGHDDGFYRRIADNYRDLVVEDERYPIKALAGIHHVTISAASRWVKGARDRGYLPEKEKKS